MSLGLTGFEGPCPTTFLKHLYFAVSINMQLSVCCLFSVASYVNPDHLQYFRFIGRLIAMVSKSNH